MKTILITGANGFLGSHLIKKSVDRGYAVRALCLPGTPVEHIRPLGAQIVRGDILKPETLRQAMKGVDLVFHVAGTTLEWHREQAFCYRINAIGARNVCRAALEAGVQRLVHTSSMSAVGSLTSVGGELDEDRLFDLWNAGLYARSKFLGEVEALRAGAHGLSVVICCPHQLLGACDFGPSTPGRIVVLFAQGRIPFYVNVKSQFLSVEDCAEGHLLAAEKGTRGERYILAGREAVDIKTFFAACADLTGRKVPRLAIPRWLVRGLALPVEWVSNRITKEPPLLTVGNANLMYRDMTCSIRKAREQLGFEPGDWRIALENAVTWFRENGYLEQRV